MKAQEAAELGRQIAALVQVNQIPQAYARLAPALAERTHFPILERIGEPIGTGPPQAVDTFLEYIAAAGTEGGWVVIAKALGQRLSRDPNGAFARCRDFIVAADIWYATDILGERVPGPALLLDFQLALTLLAPWREDANRWVRRTVGVATHFWAKRSRGAPRCVPQAEGLLAFLEPMFEEQDVDAIKGVGWGLKTLGRYYPNLVTDWLAHQVARRQRRPRALMLRKALTYLSDEQRAGATGRDAAG
jgi:3-methyladenine DNA glycosylase AlkD